MFYTILIWVVAIVILLLAALALYRILMVDSQVYKGVPIEDDQAPAENLPLSSVNVDVHKSSCAQDVHAPTAPILQNRTQRSILAGIDVLDGQAEIRQTNEAQGPNSTATVGTAGENSNDSRGDGNWGGVNTLSDTHQEHLDPRKESQVPGQSVSHPSSSSQFGGGVVQPVGPTPQVGQARLVESDQSRTPNQTTESNRPAEFEESIKADISQPEPQTELTQSIEPSPVIGVTTPISQYRAVHQASTRTTRTLLRTNFFKPEDTSTDHPEDGITGQQTSPPEAMRQLPLQPKENKVSFAVSPEIRTYDAEGAQQVERKVEQPR